VPTASLPVVFQLKLAGFTEVTFDEKAQSATRAAVAFEMGVDESIVHVSVTSRRRLKAGRRLSTFSVSVSIQSSDSSQAAEVGAALYAMKLAPQGFSSKFTEALVAVGGSLPTGFSASLPGKILVGSSAYSTDFATASECHSAVNGATTSGGRPLRCCLGQVERYHHRTQASPFNEFQFMDLPMRYTMCAQSSVKSWVLE